MSRTTQEILIDYLDNELSGQDLQEAELLLQNNLAAAKELAEMEFSISLVREAGLQQQVADIRKQFQAEKQLPELNQADKSPAVIRPMFSKVWKVAAMIIVLVGAAGAIEFSTTNSASLLNDEYSSYDLNTSRGNSIETALEQAYRNKNWAEVTGTYNSIAEKTTKGKFLAGMANMELKQYKSAISLFDSLIKDNTTAAEPLFQDEADYYLAMAYLGDGQGAKAASLLKKIRSDKNHLYYQKAGEISRFELMTLEIKGDK